MERDERTRVLCIPASECPLANCGPELAFVEPLAATAQAVRGHTMRGYQPELTRGNDAGKLAEQSIDERAATAGATADVQHRGRHGPVCALTRRLPPRIRLAALG